MDKNNNKTSVFSDDFVKRFHRSEESIKHPCRAKYIRLVDGSMKLVSVQRFNSNMFREGGFEASGWGSSDVPLDFPDVPESEKFSDDDFDIKGDYAELNFKRASRRAKINAFDIILCNPDLDVFGTFTYAPDENLDKNSYDECYKRLSVWLSNRVQRNGLKYLIVPERHKSGAIHFHGIMNSSALKLTEAFTPNGNSIKKNGKLVYNISGWSFGFSTAQIIGADEDDRTKVAKYIFKYMGKQLGEKIGGRYVLIGGSPLNRPVYEYGETIEELIPENIVPAYSKSVKVGEDIEYTELTFL